MCKNKAVQQTAGGRGFLLHDLQRILASTETEI
jgi:hypothetical protein